MDPTQLQNLLSTLGSLGSTGLGIAGNNQAYGVLQNALNTIGPTKMGNFGLNGPGGSNSSFNLQNGTGSIDLGAFNPSYSGLAGVGASGIGGYNSNLIPGLTNTAYGALNPALANLNSAYGQNGAFSSAAGTQLGSLNGTYNSIFGNTLNSLQAMQQPQVQQQAFGLQNTLFGNGTLNSGGATSGALAAGNFGSQVNAMNAQDILSAQQQALSGMQGQAGIASQLANTGSGLVSNALSNFGNTNQLISGLNTSGLNNSLSALQGAGVLNTMGLNNYNAGLQTSLSAAQARNGSLFPYAVTASSLAQKPNALNSIGNALGANGGSLLSTLFGSSGTTGTVANLLGNLFGGNNATNTSNYLNNLYGGGSTGNGSFDFGPNSSVNPDLSDLYGGGDAGTLSGLSGPPSAAGGEAATTTAPSAAPANGINLGSALSNLGSAYGAYSGFSSGNPIGEASGALNAAKLYGNLTGNAGLTSTVGNVAPVLGLYSGLSSGTPQGYVNAGLSAAQLGATYLGAGSGAAAGAAGGAAGAGAGAAGGGTASALGTGLSSVAAAAPMVGLAMYAQGTPAYTLGSQYYGRVNNTFNQTVQGGINSPDFMSNYDELINAQGAVNNGTNNANAAPLSSEQMNQLQSMYQQYLAKNMPWITGLPPAGPLGRAASGGGSGKLISFS